MGVVFYMGVDIMDNLTRANELFQEAETLFFNGNIESAVDKIIESNKLSAAHLNTPNFLQANIRRMYSHLNMELPSIPYVIENEDIIRSLLGWIGLSGIKPKYQLLELIPNKTIEWEQWDNEILPKLSKRVQIEKRKASDLLHYLNSFGYRQNIFDTIAERNSPDLVVLINDIDGTDRAVLASSIKPSDLPPLRINCRAHVNFTRLERYTIEHKERYGDIVM